MVRRELKGHPSDFGLMSNCKITLVDYIHTNKDVCTKYFRIYNTYSRKNDCIWKIDVYKIHT